MAISILGDRAASLTARWVGGRVGRGVRKAAKLRDPAARAIYLLALALFALRPSCMAGSLRVTTWNLEFPAVGGTNEARLQEAAAALRQLNPDVIRLQQVRDWKMCGQLAQALKPAQYS